jgi:hypothetical protein
MKYYNLTPITNIKESEYFSVLKEKLNDDEVRNIAITGPYGSGKSSILESFILHDKENEYLKISLANFCECQKNKDVQEVCTHTKTSNQNNTQESTPKENSTDIKSENTIETFDQNKIEELIIQQLFYQLDEKEIPYSRFNRIKFEKNKSIRNKIIFSIIWIFSLVLLPKILKLLYLNFQTISEIGIVKFFLEKIIWSSSILNLFVLSIFCFGFYFILKSFNIIIQRNLLKKVSLKSAQIEFTEQSALNKYIDELIYFFEASSNNVVIIEDLDRFNSISLFTKLREINILINNSPNVEQTVKFIYAIRDDIFKDNHNRTKFFDFILPIVPIISTNNSKEKLKELLNNETDLPQSYINDISLYIHDFRILKNIVNEFNIYNEIINKKNHNSNVFLFSLILYKNIFPEKFSLEHSDNGLLHQIFNTKKTLLLKSLISSLEEKIEKLKSIQSAIKKEKALNEIKLREEYIFEILKKHARVETICDESITEISTDASKFEKLFNNPRLDGTGYYSHNNRIDFESIQKKVNSGYNYKERLTLIKQRENNEGDNLNHKISEATKQLKKFECQKLNHLISKSLNLNWKKIIFDHENLSKNEDLLALMLRKGYINENYQLYISHFYPGSLNHSDNDFIMNVKNVSGNNLKTELTNIKEIVALINPDEFQYPSTINIQIIKYLLTLKNYKKDQRLHYLFSTISNEESFEKYILPIWDALYKDEDDDLFTNFIFLFIPNYYTIFWDVVENLYYKEDTKEFFLHSIILLDQNTLKNINENSDNKLKQYITSKKDFITSFNKYHLIEQSIKLIDCLSIKFETLEFKKYDTNQIFRYIYTNKNYQLNVDMLRLMLFHKYTKNESDFDKQFFNQNYTSIITTNKDSLNEYINENFITYIKEIYLNLENKQNESEEAILSFINKATKNSDIPLEKIFSKISTQINDLKDSNIQNFLNLLFDKNKVKPTWKNLLYYFINNENKINKHITNWLNYEKVYDQISKYKFNFDSPTEDEANAVSLLKSELLETNKLSNKAYEKIILSFKEGSDSINLDDIDTQKINLLISHNKIKLNSNYYNSLNELNEHNNLNILVIKNIDEFLENYSDYDFISDVNYNLLNSNKLTYQKKQKLLKLIPINNITRSDLATCIGNIILKSRSVSFPNNLILKIIEITNNNKLKLNLFNKHLEQFSFDQIDEILTYIGGEYEKANKLRTRPTWKNIPINISICKKLLKIKYFKSVKTEKESIKIQVRFK